MHNKTKAYLAALSSALIIGLSFLFVKTTLLYVSPLDALSHRFTVAFIVASAYLLISKKKLNLNLKDWLFIAPLSLLYPILMFLCQVLGLSQTSSSQAGMIQASIPIFTLILATIILREKPALKQILAIIISVSGVMIIISMNGVNSQDTSIIGAVLILLSTLSNAFYNILAKKYVAKYALLSVTYVMTTIAFVVFSVLSLSNHIVKGTLDHYLLPFTNQNYTLSILYLGILSSLLTSLISNYALSILPPAQMSIFSNVSVLVTVLAGIIILNETFTSLHLLGGVLIILGAIGTNFFGAKKKKLEDNALTKHKI